MAAKGFVPSDGLGLVLMMEIRLGRSPGTKDLEWPKQRPTEHGGCDPAKQSTDRLGAKRTLRRGRPTSGEKA
jgi:hypothetical protein